MRERVKLIFTQRRRKSFQDCKIFVLGSSDNTCICTLSIIRGRSRQNQGESESKGKSKDECKSEGEYVCTHSGAEQSFVSRIFINADVFHVDIIYFSWLTFYLKDKFKNIHFHTVTATPGLVNI